MHKDAMQLSQFDVELDKLKGQGSEKDEEGNYLCRKIKNKNLHEIIFFLFILRRKINDFHLRATNCRPPSGVPESSLLIKINMLAFDMFPLGNG
jgi:hypothetical protein